ncbi:MAG: methionine--tRNA ligase subunit beta [Infirmifilum sp.]|jgi:methionine--tRNA ligase beta chain|uniref:Methionine--tRNA ligase n=1 Tax=Infirmifilum uzonense TaxID=1550241 RepID=A0A0F7FG85_9CREN|nr:methionine--tRNA ligase subunit beta [Infirmifilum uzonense]AKG38145.1 methionyl-tRNA synthetase [Infirmifilum uzonense]
MSTIKLSDFQKLDIRVGRILEAQAIQKSDKLILLKVDIGSEVRQLVAGLRPYYKPEELVGKQIIVLANLEPKSLMGYTSQGMLLAAIDDGKPVLLVPEKEVKIGSKIG